MDSSRPFPTGTGSMALSRSASSRTPNNSRGPALWENTTISFPKNSRGSANTYKIETAFGPPQAGEVNVNGKKVVMMASNNYLGMSNHPVVKKAAVEAIKEYGYGMASVRFFCGTQTIHLELEKKIAKFIGTEDAILFSSAFAANNAFFPSLLNEKLGKEEYKDVIYTDGLNHASIIDGMRLCKTETTDKKIYKNNDIAQLEQLLEADKNADYRFKVIASDGVFAWRGVTPICRNWSNYPTDTMRSFSSMTVMRSELQERPDAVRRRNSACSKRSMC